MKAEAAINPATLQTDLSEWMSAREASCFTGASTGAGGTSVFIECSGSCQALLYALVHECGHLADYVFHFTPYVEPTIEDLGLGVAATPFIANWSRVVHRFPQLDPVVQDKRQGTTASAHGHDALAQLDDPGGRCTFGGQQ